MNKPLPTRRRMPAQKPGRSVQEVATPVEFIDAVQDRFGPITFDLAALKSNSVVERFYSPKDDSLQQRWHQHEGWLWLNPPFSDIGPWARKCVAEAAHGAHILLLTPASVGADWFRFHLFPNAYVLYLSPRLQFAGHPHPYPKDLALTVFCHDMHGQDTWRWM